MNLKELHEDCIEQMQALCNQIKSYNITLDHGITYEVFQQLSLEWRHINDTIISFIVSLALVAGTESGFAAGRLAKNGDSTEEETKEFFIEHEKYISNDDDDEDNK